MKKGFIKTTVKPVNTWKANVPQQIREILDRNAGEYKIVEYAGHWDGTEYDSAVININKEDVSKLSDLLVFS